MEILTGSFAAGVDYRVEAAHRDYNSAMGGAFQPEIGVAEDLPVIELKSRHLDETGTGGGVVDNTGDDTGTTTLGEK